MELRPSDFTVSGAIRSLGASKIFGSADFIGAAIIATGGTYVYVRYVPRPIGRVSIAADFLTIAGALFGVIIAGFAIVAALAGDQYARSMQRKGLHPYNVLRHFLVEGALLVAALILTITYRAGAIEIYHSSRIAEELLFGAAAFFFFWSLFGAVELMRLILSIAVSTLGSVPKDSDSSEKRAS